MLDSIKKKYHFKRYSMIKEMIGNKNGSLLDIGCGAPSDCMEDGAFLSFIGYGTGIDIICREIDFPFKIGSAEKIPFPDKSFDIITLLEVIEHVKEPNIVFKEIYRVLKDGGILIMSTPNNHLVFKCFWWIWEHFFDNMWKDEHISSYTQKKWIEIINSTGLFEVQAVKSYLKLNSMFKLKKKV